MPPPPRRWGLGGKKTGPETRTGRDTSPQARRFLAGGCKAAVASALHWAEWQGVGSGWLGSGLDWLAGLGWEWQTG